MSITEISADSVSALKRVCADKLFSQAPDVSAMTAKERKSLFEYLFVQVENDEYQQSQPLQNQNEIRTKVLELGLLVLGICDDDPDEDE